MNLRQISWALYIVGFGIVAASWVNLVSGQVGWIGWILGMIGWGIQFLPAGRKQTLAEELQRLQNLRNAGTISEQEFESAKEKLLA